MQRVASPSLLNSGIGRAAVSAAQSIMDAMAGRSSPVTVRSKHPSQDDRDSLSDDEAGKGHGRKAAASVAARFTPSIYHPRHQQHAHFNEKPTSPYDHAQAPHGMSASEFCLVVARHHDSVRNLLSTSHKHRIGQPQ